MRVLVIHPEDELLSGPWGQAGWERVIDLGRSGAQTYDRAAQAFHCMVTPLDALRQDFDEIRKVRDLLQLGLGRLQDQYGLDWWELTAILVHHQLETVILLRKFLATIGSADEVHVSRPGFQANALGLALGARLRTFPPQGSQNRGGVGHYVRVWAKFPARQLLEIFWDKTDPGYQIRGLYSAKSKPHKTPVVLLPTAYVNVSHTGVAYAESLPDTKFLLVATRRSGWLENPPANVSRAWLRSYASVRSEARKSEYADLMARWHSLREEMEAVPEFNLLSRLGGFDDFPDRFARGLEIRDAWRNVLDSEPVQAVICGDDSNPYTHIPLLLAKKKDVPAISCHHGALDGRYMFKRNHADVMLVKGRMEQDYVTRQCGVPPSQVEVGAPRIPRLVRQTSHENSPAPIVFFSEAYEVAGGRARDFYEDILPGLADVALGENRELIIKLHPSESVAERRRIVSQILPAKHQRIVHMVTGALLPEMLDRVWFGITILSTVTVECALRGIPCFLCKWLEAWPYGYVDQFSRFGAGIALNHPEEIKQIPLILQTHRQESSAFENLWNPIEPARFQELLGMSRRESLLAARPT